MQKKLFQKKNYMKKSFKKYLKKSFKKYLKKYLYI